MVDWRNFETLPSSDERSWARWWTDEATRDYPLREVGLPDSATTVLAYDASDVALGLIGSDFQFVDISFRRAAAAVRNQVAWEDINYTDPLPIGDGLRFESAQRGSLIFVAIPVRALYEVMTSQPVSFVLALLTVLKGASRFNSRWRRRGNDWIDLTITLASGEPIRIRGHAPPGITLRFLGVEIANQR